ncbi:hypothetical protein, partial [Photorhabdus viridis]|uniref:hypothetical protein n=1 Tax=Photorhabdus viridis TaxID=3163327 RepID=UPI003306AF93
VGPVRQRPVAWRSRSGQSLHLIAAVHSRNASGGHRAGFKWLLTVIFLTDGFKQYKVLTVVFTPFTTGFLLNLLIIGLRLMNADHIRFIFTDA